MVHGYFNITRNRFAHNKVILLLLYTYSQAFCLKTTATTKSLEKMS